MVINGLSRAEIDRQINARIRVLGVYELRLERKLRAEIIRIWRAGGNLNVAVDIARSNLDSIFRDHYERTAQAIAEFDGEALEDAGSDSVVATVLGGLAAWYGLRAIFATNSVVDTEVDNIRSYARTLAEQGLSPAEIASLIIQRAPTQAAWRARFIAQEETSAVADETLERELRATGLEFKRKEWIDAGDGRVRETHAAADGQIVPFDGSFEVGGYLMPKPRDGSQGAPLSETARCRCVANYLTD